ncbi:DUF4126 family protein [Streptomyces sp. NPDC088725]|uniref:DUF4126 family protein n=1 Tax=Streptomyces sp. NPDC088725 TaxID=3365873 RepID=UPI00381C767E
MSGLGESVSVPVLARVALIGVATGFRSQLGTATVALTTDSGETSCPASLLAGRWAKAITAAAAAGELVADKLPGTPSRLGAAGFVPRLLLGALAGAALAGRRPGDSTPPVIAALTGAVAAAGGTFAGAGWRAAAHSGGRPDWAAAVTEDVAALALAYAACAPCHGRQAASAPVPVTGADPDEAAAVRP